MEKAVKMSIVVQGITVDGRAFRPSDWAERMGGIMSTFNTHRYQYSPLMRPIILDGTKCLAVDPELAKIRPAAFAQVMDFAKLNRLKITEMPLESSLAPAA